MSKLHLGWKFKKRVLLAAWNQSSLKLLSAKQKMTAFFLTYTGLCNFGTNTILWKIPTLFGFRVIRYHWENDAILWWKHSLFRVTIIAHGLFIKQFFRKQLQQELMRRALKKSNTKPRTINPQFSRRFSESNVWLIFPEVCKETVPPNKTLAIIKLRQRCNETEKFCSLENFFNQCVFSTQQTSTPKLFSSQQGTSVLN